MGTSHMVAEHPALGCGNNAFTLPLLIWNSVSMGYRSDFSSCNPYYCPQFVRAFLTRVSAALRCTLQSVPSDFDMPQPWLPWACHPGV